MTNVTSPPAHYELLRIPFPETASCPFLNLGYSRCFAVLFPPPPHSSGVTLRMVQRGPDFVPARRGCVRCVLCCSPCRAPHSSSSTPPEVQFGSGAVGFRARLDELCVHTDTEGGKRQAGRYSLLLADSGLHKAGLLHGFGGCSVPCLCCWGCRSAAVHHLQPILLHPSQCRCPHSRSHAAPPALLFSL